MVVTFTKVLLCRRGKWHYLSADFRPSLRVIFMYAVQWRPPPHIAVNELETMQYQPCSRHEITAPGVGAFPITRCLFELFNANPPVRPLLLESCLFENCAMETFSSESFRRCSGRRWIVVALTHGSFPTTTSSTSLLKKVGPSPSLDRAQCWKGNPGDRRQPTCASGPDH